MGRRLKAGVLLALLAGIVAAVRVLAHDASAAWLPALSPEAARTTFRAITIGLGLAAWFTSQSLIASRGMRDGAIGDAVHDVTASWHRWLTAHDGPADALLITSSAGIDLFGIFLLGESLFGPSLRPGIGLLILFAFRQISQLTCALPTPPGMIWRRPGVPSLLVTYDVANDFFFSGHTAIAVYGGLELARRGGAGMAALAVSIVLVEAATVLVLRAHYTMDVFAGAVAAFAAYGAAASLAPHADAWLAALAGASV